MSSEPRVGGDVDAYCTRCKMPLGHTILAMVRAKIARVRCNTCQSEHVYRVGPPGSAGAKAKKPAARTVKHETTAAASDLDELLEGRDTSDARGYSLAQIFAKGEVVSHPTFGVGVVVDVRGDRFDAVFRTGVKTLAQKKAQQAFVKRHDHAERAERAEDAEDAEVGPEGPIPESSPPSSPPLEG